MSKEDFLSHEVLGHGAYLCLRRSGDGDARAVAASIGALATRLGLVNEFDPRSAPPSESIAFLRRVGATPAAVDDPGLLHADGVIHVTSMRADAMAEFCADAPGCSRGWPPSASSAASCVPRTTRVPP